MKRNIEEIYLIDKSTEGEALCSCCEASLSRGRKLCQLCSLRALSAVKHLLTYKDSKYRVILSIPKAYEMLGAIIVDSSDSMNIESGLTFIKEALDFLSSQLENGKHRFPHGREEKVALLQELYDEIVKFINTGKGVIKDAIDQIQTKRRM